MAPPPRRATLRSHGKTIIPQCTGLERPKRVSFRQKPKAESCQHLPRVPPTLKSPPKDNASAAVHTAEHVVYPSNEPKFCDGESPDSDIVGREAERLLIQNFIRSAIDERRSATLYISGAPGTGKSAVILRESRSFERKRGCHVAAVNCMHLRTASAIFGHLIQSIKSARSGKENFAIMNNKEVENLLNRLINQGTLLLILDEVDQLICQSQDILYRIFNWPEVLDCHVIIIGISNALDLPERLPKLKSKLHRPMHVTFPSYTRDELSAIVSAKLNLHVQTSEERIIDPLAIQLCARKISASTGDVRTALDVCHRAIDLAAQEAKRRKTTDMPCSVRPSLQHISMALKEFSGIRHGPQPMVVAESGSCLRKTEEIPLHHKLLIASCQLLKKQRGKHMVPFTELCDTYGLVCRTYQLIKLEEYELVTICGLLESRGYLEFLASKGSANTKQSTPARFRCVRLRLDDHTVKELLSGDLFSNILNLII